MDIKEESCFPNFCSQNERDIKDLVKKVKIETTTSGSCIKPELEDSSCSQNEEQHLMRFNKTINKSEIESKIDIKEEQWWLEREDSCINDIKDGTHDNFYSTKPSSSNIDDVSRDISDLFASEDSGNDLSFKMNNGNPECESERKCQKQESVVIDISSTETSVFSETLNDGKTASIASSSEQSNVLQQSNTNKQDINNKSCKSIFSHEYRGSYKCYISKKCHKYPSHLEKHILLLDSKEANKCDVQDKRLNQLSSLKTQTDDSKRIYKCNICNKAFTHLSHLKIHILIHDGIKPHKCNICSMAFTQSSNLNSHKLIHDGIKPHKCDICNMAFTRLSSLKTHKLIHEGVKPHKCNICSKAFTQLPDLKRHKLFHEGIKPHTCSRCNKDFTRSSNLKKHMNIHGGIKLHKCNVCNKACTQLSDLKIHKLIHEGIKPHKCDICNKAFTRLSSLKTHKLIHESIKPHMCNICNKHFSQSSNFKRHKLIHKDAQV